MAESVHFQPTFNVANSMFKTRILKEGQGNMMAPTTYTVLLINGFTCPHAGNPSVACVYVAINEISEFTNLTNEDLF